MWAVGRVTQATASFSIPMSAVAVAAALAAIAGWKVSREVESPDGLRVSTNA